MVGYTGTHQPRRPLREPKYDTPDFVGSTHNLARSLRQRAQLRAGYNTRKRPQPHPTAGGRGAAGQWRQTYWRLGYMRRSDAGKAELHQFLRKTQERPLDAVLVWNEEQKTYQAVTEPEPPPEDGLYDDIPY